MFKLSETKEGLKRIIDAATENFMALAKKEGIDPDSPEITGETEEEGEGENNGEEGAEGESGNDEGPL